MRQENRAIREEQIERAAYEVLEEKGYAGASMLAIARRARASNETLYNWYGDKRGLFRALVARNAAEVKAMLAQAIEAETNASDTFRAIGPVLLDLLSGERAVALNRAAAADPTGELGRAISQEGRETVAPMIAEVLERGRASGSLCFADRDLALDLYLSLLIGDLQIRRVIGMAPKPSAAERRERSDRAIDNLLRLLQPKHART